MSTGRSDERSGSERSSDPKIAFYEPAPRVRYRAVGSAPALRAGNDFSIASDRKIDVYIFKSIILLMNSNIYTVLSDEYRGERKKRKKYCFYDTDTNEWYAGGGIVFYDDQGIWVIKEKDQYNDIGGKYNYNDGNIYACIARELGEETYHTIQLSLQELLNISKKIFKIGENKFYLSIWLHTDSVPEKPDSEKFLQARNKTLLQNPLSTHLYKQTELAYIPFDELQNYKLSSRLQLILKNSFVWELILN